MDREERETGSDKERKAREIGERSSRRSRMERKKMDGEIRRAMREEREKALLSNFAEQQTIACTFHTSSPYKQ